VGVVVEVAAVIVTGGSVVCGPVVVDVATVAGRTTEIVAVGAEAGGAVRSTADASPHAAKTQATRTPIFQYLSIPLFRHPAPPA
jgi:hypothetical protein